MKLAFENLQTGVKPGSIEHTFLPSKLAEELLFYPTWTGHYFCSSQYYVKRETHPTLLLIYVVRGMFHIEYRNKIYDARKDEVILLDCREPHYYQAYEGLEFYYYGFIGSNSSEICHYILDTRGPIIRSKNNRLIGNLIKDALDYYEQNHSENPFDASMRIYKILNILLQEREVYNSAKNEPVERTIIYIHANLKKYITMKSLADMVGLSTSYFSYLFKMETGCSPREYITNTRMNKAKLLLVQTNKNIAEIAHEVGYSNGASFTGVFTDKIGCSPKLFRKLMRGSKNSQ